MYEFNISLLIPAKKFYASPGRKKTVLSEVSTYTRKIMEVSTWNHYFLFQFPAVTL